MAVTRRRVRIESPARLHLGFLDLNGALGRRFGSMGLAIDGLSATVVAEPAPRLSIDGVHAPRVRELAARILAAFELPQTIALRVEASTPVHAGLGSGTQLSLAVGAAIAACFGRLIDAREIAAITRRGQRSGIGVGVFDTGGFVLDGGHGAATAVPPVISRLPFPDAWRILIVFDHGTRGLNGPAEREAFATLPPMDERHAAQLCRSVLMGVLPALAEHDFPAFSRRITEVQTLLGMYFAPRQGGHYTSARVCAALDWLDDNYGMTGRGQSSWGPTGFAFVEGARQADGMLRGLRRRFIAERGLEFQLCRGCNDGAQVMLLEEVTRQPAVSAG